MESLRQLERETLLFLRIFIEGYPLCHLCFREVLPLITDSVYFSHVWCSRLDSVLWATVPLSQSFLWTLQPFAINLCVVLGWPTQRARYFLDAVFHFPMASYCENAMVGSLCQHCFPFPSSPQPAHGRQTRTIPAWAAPFAQCCLWFGNFDYCPTLCGLLARQDGRWQHHICPKLLFQPLFLVAAFSIAGFFSFDYERNRAMFHVFCKRWCLSNL